MKQIGNSTVLQMIVSIVPSKSQSGISIMLRVWSSCLKANVESMKQYVKPESTSVANVMEGIRSEVSYNVKVWT